MEIKRTGKEIATTHPMEDVFDIEEGTTIVTREERETEIVCDETYDDKDNEIEEQIQEVYDAAMGAFESQCDEAELVEGKYKARNAEVAVQFLSAALSAAKEKRSMKEHKDKHLIASGKVKGAGPGVTNNNLIVADRNELLREMGLIPKDPVSEQ